MPAIRAHQALSVVAFGYLANEAGHRVRNCESLKSHISRLRQECDKKSLSRVRRPEWAASVLAETQISGRVFMLEIYHPVGYKNVSNATARLGLRRFILSSWTAV
jgi:hypothetical protein